MQTLRRHLADSLQAQWAADQQRAEQIAALTHDLKTPLTVISGHAELLAEEDLPPAARESAEAIRRGADRAGQYLADLRAAAAPGAGQEPAAPVEAAGFAAGRAGVGRALCAAAGLTFEMETDLPAGLRFPAQEGRLARAVDNLLDNAVRHTPAGGTVRLTAALQDGALVFRVRDSGPGLYPRGAAQGRPAAVHRRPGPPRPPPGPGAVPGPPGGRGPRRRAGTAQRRGRRRRGDAVGAPGRRGDSLIYNKPGRHLPSRFVCPPYWARVVIVMSPRLEVILALQPVSSARASAAPSRAPCLVGFLIRRPPSLPWRQISTDFSSGVRSPAPPLREAVQHGLQVGQFRSPSPSVRQFHWTRQSLPSSTK